MDLGTPPHEGPAYQPFTQHTLPGDGPQPPAAPPECPARGVAGIPRLTVGASRPGRTAGRVPFPGWLAAGLAYFAASFLMWWHVWTGDPAATMTCACGDPPSFVWFLAWPAYAIRHGHSLFFAPMVHVPTGINLLDNTSVLALGVALAPVTWLFGPIATLNVALTLAPALTAWSAYGFLRRGLRLRWAAALLGGLLFGFSPYVVRNEAMNHLHASFLALLPLIFWCCYELAVTQRGKWWRWGLGLGLLIGLQYFIGPEVLAAAAIMTAVGLALAALAGASTLRARLPFAWRGFGLAGVISAVLLAYPLWFTVAGPGHVKGADWAHPHASGLALWLLPLGRPLGYQHSWRSAGYLGPIGTAEGYLGIPAVLILVAALIVLRRPLVRLCVAMTAISVWLSLGAFTQPLGQGGEPGWLVLPWRAFAQLPVLSKLAPATFAVPAQWCTVIVGALLTDALLRRAAPADAAGGGPDPAPPAAPSWPGIPRTPRGWRLTAGLLAVVLAVPWLLAWRLPYTAGHVATPQWATRLTAYLPSRAVVLFYPFPATHFDQVLVWQAESGMRYSIAGGRGIVPGPGGGVDHGWIPGTPEGIMSALTVRSVPEYPLQLPPPPDPATVRSFRTALRQWHVTDVVVSDGGRGPGYARRWLADAVGSAPQRVDGAWIWRDVQRLIR